MNFISCERCGVVLNQDNFEEGEFIIEKGMGERVVKCPVCGNYVKTN